MRSGTFVLFLAGALLILSASLSSGGVERSGNDRIRFAIHLAEEEFTGQFPTTLRLEGIGFCSSPIVQVGVPGFGLLEATVLESTNREIRVGLFGDDFAPYTAAVVVSCPRATRTLYATLGLVAGGPVPVNNTE